jgi:hypothetical protein
MAREKYAQQKTGHRALRISTLGLIVQDIIPEYFLKEYSDLNSSDKNNCVAITISISSSLL